MTGTPPSTEFADLVVGLKAAIAAGDTGKADMYRAEIEAVPDHIDQMAAMIP